MLPRTTTSQDGNLTITETVFDNTQSLGVKTVMNVTTTGVIFQLVQTMSDHYYEGDKKNYEENEY